MDWHITSRNFALISVQSAKNMSVYSGIRQEYCKIGWYVAGARIGPNSMLFQSGRGSTKEN
jgi:hypothetical protein